MTTSLVASSVNGLSCRWVNQKSEVGLSRLRSWCQPKRVSSGGFRGEPVSSPFPGSRGHPRSLAPGIVLLLEPTPLHLCDHPSMVTSPSDSPLLHSSSTSRDAWDDIGSTWIIYESLPISRSAESNSHCLCHVTKHSHRLQ